MRSSIIKLAAICFSLILLSACSQTIKVGNMFGFGKKEKKVVVKNCPVMGTLSQASSLTKFASGSKPDVNNILYDAYIARVAIDCKVVGSRVIAEFGMSGRITTGPKGTPGEKFLPVFAALTLKDQDVIRKIHRTSSVTLKAGERTQAFIETVKDFTIEMAPGKKPTDYEILVGFDLTPAQLAYNRRK